MGRYLDLARGQAGKAVGSSLPPVVEPSKPALPPTVVAIDAKPDRLAEVRAAYLEAMGRLASLYPAGIDNAWAEIAAWPDWVRDIEIAETAADREALAYQSGATTNSFPFLAAIKAWEATWEDALVATIARKCQDCGRSDCTALVTTATGAILPPLPSGGRAGYSRVLETMMPKRPAKRKPSPQGGPRTYGRLQRALDEAARREIEAALAETKGQVVAASVVLGISKVALWKRMRALGIKAQP